MTSYAQAPWGGEKPCDAFEKLPIQIVPLSADGFPPLLGSTLNSQLDDLTPAPALQTLWHSLS